MGISLPACASPQGGVRTNCWLAGTAPPAPEALCLLEIRSSNERAWLGGDEHGALHGLVGPDLVHDVGELRTQLLGQGVHLGAEQQPQQELTWSPHLLQLPCPSTKPTPGQNPAAGRL